VAASPGAPVSPWIGQEEWFEMNKVFLVGRLTRDPELRTLPSGKPVANFVVATNEFRGGGAPERTEYHNLVAWDRQADQVTRRRCAHNSPTPMRTAAAAPTTMANSIPHGTSSPNGHS